MKALDNIVKELIELGFSERKIVNQLKNIKKTLIQEEEEDLFKDVDSKKYNKLINELIYDKFFLLETPTMPLLGYVKSIKKLYGSECVYYVLYQVGSRDYIYNDIYSKSDEEKCNRLMFLLKENLKKYVKDFNNTKYN